MCTSGRNTQKYQRWWLVAPEGCTSPAVWIFLVSNFIIILMTLEWLLKYEGQSCIGNLLLLLRTASWPFLDFSYSPWTAGLNLSRGTVSSLALPSSVALSLWWRGEMECFEFPFWILETGIAAAEQVLILSAVLCKAGMGCKGLTLHCWKHTTVLGQVGLDRSGKHLPPILLRCFLPVLHLEGIYMHRMVFPSTLLKENTSYISDFFMEKYRNSCLIITCLLWKQQQKHKQIKKPVNSSIPFPVWSAIYATVLSPDWEKLMTSNLWW